MDMTLECKDCGTGFVLTEKNQEWYRRKGFALPKRCPTCRKNRVYDERYEGWWETMYHPKPHKRVNPYAYHKFF